MSEVDVKPRGKKLTCPICSSTFFNIFPAGECQTCSQLVCGHCIHHDNPDHPKSTCQDCIAKATPSGRIALLNKEDLLTLLKNPNSENRVLVAREMGDREDPAFMSSLCNALESDQSDLRREAAAALGKLNSDEAIPFLINVLNDSAPAVRGRAAASLAGLGAVEASEPIIKQIGDSSLQAAGHAVWAVGKLMGQDACKTLNDLITSHSSNFIRCEALAVLAGLDHNQALAASLECLNDPKKEVIISACKILAKLNDQKVIPVLEKRIKTIPSALAKLRAEATLNKLRDPDENLN